MKLPKTLISKNKVILCFSVLVTGRCNANCGYCHYFAANKREDVALDINDELFHLYCLMIKGAKNNLPDNIEVQCRFSGGEPTILGDRLFELADKMYVETGIKPYVLTNGDLLEESFIIKARESKISHFYVSMENPLETDSGSFNFYDIAKKIVKCHSVDLPVIPAITIISNDHFKNLFEIAKIFYKELGCLPTFSELSYGSYQSPTESQLSELYDNVKKTVEHFKDKAPIKMFPYISPELSYGTADHYVTEVDFLNKYGVNKENFQEKLMFLLGRLDVDYPEYSCDKIDCDWHDSCSKLKWVWTHDFNENEPEVKEKLKSYCALKKTLNEAFYDALVGGN